MADIYYFLDRIYLGNYMGKQTKSYFLLQNISRVKIKCHFRVGHLVQFDGYVI